MNNMNYEELTCIDCNGKFSLTDFGKELYKKNDMGSPKRCLQCSVIASIRKGEEPKNMDKLIKTNSNYWTEERIAECNTKIYNESSSLHTDSVKRKQQKNTRD